MVKKFIFTSLLLFVFVSEVLEATQTYTCSTTNSANVRINQIYNPQTGDQIGYIELYVDQGPISLKDWNICYNEKCIKIGEGNGNVYLNGLHTGTDNLLSFPDNAFIVFSETLFSTTGNAANTFTQSKGEALLLDNLNNAAHYLNYFNSTFNSPLWGAGSSCTTSYALPSASNFGICATPDFSLSQWSYDCNNTMGWYNTGVDPSSLPSTFDAWEPIQGVLFPASPKLYTKIASSPFPIHIGPKTGSFTGTVCARVQPDGGWKSVYFNNETYKAIPDLLYSKATKSTQIDLWFKKDVNEGITNCTNYTDKNISSDLFSIRPAAFSLSPTTIKTGEEVNVSTIGGWGYNGSANVTTSLTNPNCSTTNKFLSTTEPKALTFIADNNNSTLIAQDIGDINVTISDTTWTAVDRLSDCDTTITGGSVSNGKAGCDINTTLSLTINPYELNTTLQGFSPSSTPPWLYLDSSRTQHVEINATVRAYSKDGVTISKNFSDGCSASAVPLGFYFTPTGTIPSDLNVSLTSATGSTTTVPNLNSTYATAFNGQFFTIPSTSFKNGDSNLSLKFNFIRSDSTPINPFDLNLTSIKTSSGYVNNNDTNLSHKATFVYGRVHTYDIKTDQPTTINPVELEVYGKNSTNAFLSNMPQNVLYWYRNINHDSNLSGSVLSGNTDVPTISINPYAYPPLDGLHPIQINYSGTNPITKTVHLAIPQWLWYSQSGKSYISTGIDCTLHPCFEYQFFGTAVSNGGVQSGTFKGADFNLTPAKTIIKKGVKVFR